MGAEGDAAVGVEQGEGCGGAGVDVGDEGCYGCVDGFFVLGCDADVVGCREGSDGLGAFCLLELAEGKVS